MQDLIYVVLLVSCSVFGHFYRKLEGVDSRKWAGTTFGVIVAYIASGPDFVHALITVVVNAFVISKLSWRVCHIVSFVFTYSYLLFFFRILDWYGLPFPSGPANLIQMILSLKLTGLAFEVNNANVTKDDVRGDNLPILKQVGFLDVVHYSLNFCGVLTGPYYRFRTYYDWFHRPFSDKIDHWKFTKVKIAEAMLYYAIHLCSEYYFPLKYCTSEEFNERSFGFRLFYMYPSFLSMRMRLFAGMMLSECVCYMAGLGAYPSSCDCVPGMGPKNYKVVEELSKNPEAVKKEDLDFEAVHNMYVFIVETCPSTRIAMKMWNTCVQYWLVTCVYKKFPIKPLKMLVTLIFSGLWHGYSPGYYLAMCQIVIFTPSEDLFNKFYRNMEEGTLQRKVWAIFLAFERLSWLSYLGLSFYLLTYEDTMKYWKSVYFIGHILAVVCYVIAVMIKPYYLPKKTEEESKVEKKKEH